MANEDLINAALQKASDEAKKDRAPGVYEKPVTEDVYPRAARPEQGQYSRDPLALIPGLSEGLGYPTSTAPPSRVPGQTFGGAMGQQMAQPNLTGLQTSAFEALRSQGLTEKEAAARVLDFPGPEQTLTDKGNFLGAGSTPAAPAQPQLAGPEPSAAGVAGSVGGYGGGGGGSLRGGKGSFEQSTVHAIRGLNLPPEVHGRLESADENAKFAAQQRMLADVQAQRARQSTAEDQAHQILITNNQLERLQTDEDTYVKQEGQRLKDFSMRVNAQEIDPGRYWHNMNAFGRFASFVAAALGGFAGGFSGTGRNVALEHMQKEVDNDIRAQVATADKNIHALDIQRSIYRQALEEFGDKRRAILATRQAYIELQNKMLDARLAEIGAGPEAQAKYAEAINKLDKDSVNHEVEFAKVNSDKFIEEIKTKQTTGGGGGGAGGVGGAAVPGGRLTPTSVAAALGYSPKTGPHQVSEDLRHLAKEIPAEQVQALSAIDRLDTWIQQHPNMPGFGPLEGRAAAIAKGFSPKEWQEGRSLYSAVSVPVTHHYAGSAQTTQELARLNEMLSSGAPPEVIRQQLANVKAAAASHVQSKSAGVDPLVMRLYVQGLNSPEAVDMAGELAGTGRGVDKTQAAKDVAKKYVTDPIQFTPKGK